MSRLTEPLVPRTARAVENRYIEQKWFVFADGEDGKPYCVGAFVTEELARKFAAEWNSASENQGWSRHGTIGGSFSDPPERNGIPAGTVDKMIQLAVQIEREECARTVIDCLKCWKNVEPTSALNVAVLRIRERKS